MHISSHFLRLSAFIAVILFMNVQPGFAVGKHQFRIGQDIYYRDYDEKGLTPPGKSHEFGWLWGLNLGYDYVATCNFYVGADLNISGGQTVYDGSLQNFVTGEIRPYRNHTENVFFDSEARVGYTFSISKKTLLSPFIGCGFHFWHRGSAPDNPYGYDEDYQWPYFCLGIRLEHAFSQIFSGGLNLKVMRMVSGQMESDDLADQIFNLGNRFQFAVEVPLTYHFTCSNWWINSFRLTPYFVNRNIGRSNIVIAPFSGIGLVSLIEPDSETYVFGARFELMHSF